MRRRTEEKNDWFTLPGEQGAPKVRYGLLRGEGGDD